jgi:hypothetical protein
LLRSPITVRPFSRVVFWNSMSGLLRGKQGERSKGQSNSKIAGSRIGFGFYFSL